MSKMTIVINDKRISKEAVDAWELNRLKHQYKYLSKRGFSLDKSNLTLENIDQARRDLGLEKAARSPEVFRKMLKRSYSTGNYLSKVAASISRGKRKFSVTEFIIEDSSLSPEEVMKRIENIMLKNTKNHLYMNLATNPDHFVLISTGTNIQEVVEITGGSPFSNRFFAHYGDEVGLTSKLGTGYTAQAAGAAKLEDGTVIGGVRHQVKREGNGFRVKALVEFPSILPNYMIRQHQYHLACEFRQWLNYVIE